MRLFSPLNIWYYSVVLSRVLGEIGKIGENFLKFLADGATQLRVLDCEGTVQYLVVVSITIVTLTAILTG